MPAKAHPDTASRRTHWEDLRPEDLQTIARLARDEDLKGWGFVRQASVAEDITSALLLADLPESQSQLQAVIRTRAPITVCGLRFIPLLLAEYHQELSFSPADNISDGTQIEAGTILGTLSGPASFLLAAERVVLNFIQHLSGVATLTARHVASLQGSPTRLLDTRKTHPLYRALEKYAVSTGGGWNHRRGLYDRFMLKDNHLALLEQVHGSRWPDHIRERKQQRPGCLIEVEVDRLEQLTPLLEHDWIDVVLLDNFSPEETLRALDLIQNRFLTELSGGVTLQTLPKIGALGADFVSCGALTHQSQWPDIGLDIL